MADTWWLGPVSFHALPPHSPAASLPNLSVSLKTGWNWSDQAFVGIWQRPNSGLTGGHRDLEGFQAGEGMFFWIINAFVMENTVIPVAEKMCICTCVFTSVHRCAHVCYTHLHVYMHECILCTAVSLHACTHTCACTCTHVYVHTCIVCAVCACTRGHMVHIHVCSHAHSMHVCTCILTCCVHTRVCAHVYLCMYHVRVCTHVRLYMHTYAVCVHQRTHICVHTCICVPTTPFPTLKDSPWLTVFFPPDKYSSLCVELSGNDSQQGFISSLL
jgi:hypothetical protein